MTRPRRHTFSSTASACALLVVVACLPARTAWSSMVDLKPGDLAPAIALPDNADIEDTTGLKGRVIVILFGEVGQPRTQAACEEVIAMMQEAHASQDEQPVWVTVLAKHGDPDEFSAALGAARRPDHVLVDADRAAFGAYGVVVAPTTVVVDAEGRIVHTLSGYNYRFSDNLQYALQFSHGKLTKDAFELALAGRLTASPDQQAIRAERIARLAYRLHQRGMFELAEQKYREALELRPDFAGARVALGALLIEQDRLEEASRQYMKVLHEAPEHHGAILGLAHICIRRNPPDVAEAEQLLNKALDQRPDSAPAQFLMGVLHEEKGEYPEAARRYRLAASLALKSRWPAEPSLSQNPRSSERGDQ